MLSFVGQALGYIIPFLLVLTLVVTIHELGHFAVARLFGIRVDRFSIGFGKSIVSRTDKHGIEWRLAWLPLGGYVKFSGDVDASSVPDKRGLEALRSEIIAEEGAGAERDYFHFKPVWQRALVVLAGPMANFALAIVIFTGLTLVAGEMIIVKPRVGSVEPDSPAAAAGFLPGDLIERADGRRINEWPDLAQHVMMRAGDPIRFTVERDGTELQLVATPAPREAANRIDGSTMRMGYLGLGSSTAAEDILRKRYNPIEAVGVGVGQTFGIMDTTITYLKRIFSGRESGDQLSGPLGIAQASGAVAGAAVEGVEDVGLAAQRLVLSLLTLAGLLSVGIGFLNLLPVPVLDGGHLVFYAYEAVARRPLGARVQEAGYRVGLALLVGLMLFATWNDLQKLSVLDFLGGLVS